MDLDDLLEDLLEGVQRRGRTLWSERGRPRQARLLRAIGRIAGGAGIAVAGGGALVLAATTGGVGDLVGGAGVVSGGLLAASGFTASRAARKAQRRRDEARRLGPPTPARRIGRRRQAASALVLADARDLPKAARPDWARLEQALRLVDDLVADGWVDLAAQAEVHAEVDRLGRLLVADRRTSDIGGRANRDLVAQLGELADLLVALADEAVTHQAAIGADAGVPATLHEARERLVALREAREELDRLDHTRRGEVTRQRPDASPATGPRPDELPPPQPRPGT